MAVVRLFFLFSYLVGQVVVQAHCLDEVELGLQPLDVAF